MLRNDVKLQSRQSFSNISCQWTTWNWFGFFLWQFSPDGWTFQETCKHWGYVPGFVAVVAEEVNIQLLMDSWLTEASSDKADQTWCMCITATHLLHSRLCRFVGIWINCKTCNIFVLLFLINCYLWVLGGAGAWIVLFWRWGSLCGGYRRMQGGLQLCLLMITFWLNMNEDPVVVTMFAWNFFQLLSCDDTWLQRQSLQWALLLHMNLLFC